MQRRIFASSLLVSPWWAHAQSDALARRLRAGACVVVLRHAQTDPGIGDPPGFRLDRCSTQRNLSDEGRRQAQSIGRWFASRSLAPQAVQSSAWCRCRDTADLAFGRHAVWPALNSFFGQRGAADPQTAQLRAALQRVPAGQFEVWVTHQVNVTELTGEGIAMGEGLILDATGKTAGRSQFV
ncbi:MAG: Phosphoglycerate mutase [Polaromonas sp.]|nr:Phosphoglycerate mutase [Polaromonas sp.]